MQHTAPQVKLSPHMLEGGIHRGTRSHVPMMEHEEQLERLAKGAEQKSFSKLQDEYRLAKREEIKARNEGRNKEVVVHERNVERLKKEMKEAYNK